MSFNVFIIISMAGFLGMSKQKAPPRISLEGAGAGDGEICVGEGSEIPPSFRRKLSVSSFLL
jgi:hypothetical protein